MNLDAHIRQFGNLAEKTRESLWNYVSVFVPKVEHISEKVDCGSLVLDAVEESHEPSLLCSPVLDGERAEVRIRKKIYVLHILNVEG